MPGDAIQVIGGFLLRPMKGLPWIVLLVTDVRDVRHGSERVREIEQTPICYGEKLAAGSVSVEKARELLCHFTNSEPR